MCAHDPTPALLDLPALAERLGVNHRHIRRLVAERRIPFIKRGHLLRFDPGDIDDWLESCRRQPIDRDASSDRWLGGTPRVTVGSRGRRRPVRLRIDDQVPASRRQGTRSSR
ncbi:MAG: hypothetical protein JWP02_3033 [Acidimicrobiales bacterium]|nr:hypothetical protein [Acidimicrobiales bacterium]